MIRLVSGSFKHRQTGSAMIYALLFAAIVSIGITQVVRMTEQSQTVTKGDELKSVRDKLRRRLQTIASLDDAILKSKSMAVGMNDPLRGCTSREQNASCSADSPGQMYRFALYSPEGQLLTSSGEAPALYDRRGNVCTEPAKCVFEATSYFWALCHDAADRGCAKRETLFTIVQVRMIPGAPITPAVSPLPRDSEMFGSDQEMVRKWANKLSIDQIVGADRTSECPPGQAPTMSTEGSVTCQDISAAGSCPLGTLFIGINSLGKPKCQPIGKEACVSGTRVGTHTCTDGGCVQNTRLDFKCDPSTTGRPRRLVYLRPNAQECRTISAPVKKAVPNGIGTQLCTTAYEYSCCE